MSPNEEASAVDREWIEFGAGRSNTIVLSESEACVAKALLEEVQGHSNRLTLEISRMQANLDDLKAQHEAVAARIDRLQTALAPHKRLPSELLSAIFFDTLDSGGALFVPDSPAESWPWPLRKVCSRWRDVAVSDIRLWDSVTCRLQKWDFRVGESLASVLQSIKAICKAAPSRFEIDIHRYTDHGLEGYVQFEPFHLNSFPPLPTPITGISLSLPPLCLIQFFHSSSSKFPSLTSLSLDLQHVRPMDHLLTELFYGAISSASTPPHVYHPVKASCSSSPPVLNLRSQFLLSAASRRSLKGKCSPVIFNSERYILMGSTAFVIPLLPPGGCRVPRNGVRIN